MEQMHSTNEHVTNEHGQTNTRVPSLDKVNWFDCREKAYTATKVHT